MSKQDKTFSPVSEFGSSLWAATALGMSIESFYRHLATLQQEGFPEKDLLLKKFLKADVLAWIKTRRRNSDTDGGPKHTNPTSEEVNYDGV
jgi:predicted DNA-binding transcriptional regulator AlpA